MARSRTRMGSVYLRRHIYWIKYGPGKHPIRESSGSHNKADATRLLRTREAAWRKHQPRWRVIKLYTEGWQFTNGTKQMLLKGHVNKTQLARMVRALNQ